MTGMCCFKKCDKEKKARILSIPNDDLALLIDKIIKGETMRKLLKRRLIDGIKFESLAEEFNYSVRQTKSLIYKAQSILFPYI